MLTVALVASSYLALRQERLYKEHGKHPAEVRFYIHALSLPLFSLFGQDIVRSAAQFSAEPPLELYGLSLYLSRSWYLLLATCLFQ